MAVRKVDVLLIGGGIASASAAAELRAEGFDGSILLATREQDSPYHRPPITKDYLQGRTAREHTQIHAPDWWADNRVELALRTPVMALDAALRTAKVGKEEIEFEHALLATGAMVRRLQVDGAQLDGIHYLRALGNADALRRELQDAGRIAIVGGSYIATEVAASLTALGHQVTIVMQEQRPLERTFGNQVGEYVAGELRDRGVKLLGGEDVVCFEGEQRAEAVITASGHRIPADVIVVGVGGTADATLAKRAGLELGNTGGVRCDAALRTSTPAIFAAGDVCEFDSALHGRPVRIEHEHVAAAQGRLAARNILTDGAEPFTDVPYFWCDLGDWLKLEYVGLGGAWNDAQIHRCTPQPGFAVRYTRDGKLVGVLSLNHATDLDDARAEFMAIAGGRETEPIASIAATSGST